MITTTKPSAAKAECLNPNTGSRKNIDKATYDLFADAIYRVLKKEGAVTFTQLVEGVEEYLKQQGVTFKGSVGWFTITVKKDSEARGLIEVIKVKGRSLNRLKTQDCV